jgi:hypothetical protein
LSRYIGIGRGRFLKTPLLLKEGQPRRGGVVMNSITNYGDIYHEALEERKASPCSVAARGFCDLRTFLI